MALQVSALEVALWVPSGGGQSAVQWCKGVGSHGAMRLHSAVAVVVLPGGTGEGVVLVP